MPALRVDDPAEIEGLFDRAFNPGAAIANASPGRRLAGGVAAFFNGAETLGVADVTEYEASYRHRMSDAGLIFEMLHSSGEYHKVIRFVIASDT